jgi:hypothetical protein
MSTQNTLKHLDYLLRIATEDAKITAVTDTQYGGSWKRRGGMGAFFTLARKWDRLEARLTDNQYDIFRAAVEDNRPEGLMDDIRDLRRYLMLVEAELRAHDERVANLTERDSKALAEFEEQYTFGPEGFGKKVLYIKLSREQFEKQEFQHIGSFDMGKYDAAVERLARQLPDPADEEPRSGQERRKAITINNLYGYAPDHRKTIRRAADR